jgi:ribonuclease Z
MRLALTILGSNSALPAYGRFPTSQVLDTGQRLFMIDCGEGAQIQMNRFRIRRSRIERVFISHLHGDHVFGLPGLITSYAHFGRRDPLFVYGPEGLEELITTCLKFTGNPLRFELRFVVVDTETSSLIFEDDQICVKSFKLFHRVPTCGYRFTIKSGSPNMSGEMLEKKQVPLRMREFIRKGEDFVDADGTITPASDFFLPLEDPIEYAYVSDSMFEPAVVEAVKDVDILYHEATFMEELHHKALETKHSTALDAAKAAKLANVGFLVIGHFSSRYRSLSPLLEEARKVFADTELAREGNVFFLR